MARQAGKAARLGKDCDTPAGSLRHAGGIGPARRRDRPGTDLADPSGWLATRRRPWPELGVRAGLRGPGQAAAGDLVPSTCADG